MRLVVRLKEQGAKTKSIRAVLATVEYMCEGNRAAWKQVEMSVSSDLVVVIIPGVPDWNPIAASEGPQKMTEMVLRDGEKRMEIASHTPSIISVSRRGSRPRAWSQVQPNFR